MVILALFVGDIFFQTCTQATRNHIRLGIYKRQPQIVGLCILPLRPKMWPNWRRSDRDLLRVFEEFEQDETSPACDEFAPQENQASPIMLKKEKRGNEETRGGKKGGKKAMR